MNQFINQSKILALDKEKTLFLTKFAVLLGISIMAPFFLNQMATGPIVNAVLFITTVILGIESAVLIALTPSLIALSVGLLPSVLTPTVPFIMAGNIILVLIFNLFRKKNYWLGVVLAGFLKFAFLYCSSSIVVDLIIKKEAASKAVSMLSWPQLLTALAGGVIAYFVLKFIKER